MTPEDYLVPDPQVKKEFGITSMTLWRWTRDSALGFPPQVKINTRNYRSRRELDEFKARMAASTRVARRPGNKTSKLHDDLKAMNELFTRQFKTIKSRQVNEIRGCLEKLENLRGNH